MNKPRLECTKDYSLFDMHELNRDLHEDPALEESMKNHGFMPSCPIHCRPAKRGNKLKIIRGHHRFHYARRLGLPVYYVIDESNCDMFDLEGSSKQRWSVIDWAVARAKTGNKDYEFLLRFMKKHGLTIGAAASLLGGQSAGSNNKLKDIKTGTFKVGDMKHANAVIGITDLCREQGYAFATSSSFVHAISLVLLLGPEFDANKFCHNIKVYPNKMRQCSRVDDYLDEISALYNYRSKAPLLIKHRAQKAARERQKSFGKHNG